MAAYNEQEKRVLIYLENRHVEQRGHHARSKRGVEKAEIMRDCSLDESQYSTVIGRIEGDRIVETTARGATGEFVNVNDSIIDVVRDLAPPVGEADANIKLDELKDSGLYGTVWKATQTKPARTVAVKIVNPEFGMSFNAAEHANGLVKAGAHPNIVAVYQVTKVVHPHTNEVVDAVVMEWLDGVGLGHRLGELPLLSVGEAKIICDGILSGVAHLHTKGVTHSDLHVGNVILTAQGPRIIDIDYSSEKSLARLTTLAQNHRKQADIAQVVQLLGMVIRKTAISQQNFIDHEKTLRCATELEGVRGLIAQVFEQSKPSSAQALPVKESSQPTDSGIESLAYNVEAAIENRRKVTLRRLVMKTVGSIATELAGDKYPANGAIDLELLRERVTSYKGTIRPFLPALGLLGFWGGKLATSLAVEAIDRLANAQEHSSGGRMGYVALRRYPVVSGLYGFGICAVAGRNYRGLFSILRDTVYYDHGERKRRLWTELAYWFAEQRELWNRILGRDMYFPVSQVLEDDLRDALAETIPSKLRYVETFDRFEFFASLDHFLFNGRALGVSFLWRRQKSQEGDLLSEIRAEAASAGAAWEPLKAGLLNGTNKTNALQVLDDFGRSVQEVMGSYHVF